MNLTAEHLEKLMAYADGELESKEKSEVDAMLASNAEAAAFVANLRGLSDPIRAAYEAGDGKKVAAHDADFTNAIMAKIESASVEGGKVVPITSRPSKSRTAPIVGGVVAVLALAAATFLVARPKETPMAKGPVDAPRASTTAVASNESGNSTGIEVNAVESPGQSVSVLYLPSANELSTSVVVWIEETGEK